ncbi:MAG TPA: serine/threonine-protein kinase [Acidobacteriota bacterium]|nr:serine/threonine-protein kinase [Acidobacteriota bacterium]
MIGKTLVHYQITGLLGKGGMGEVYRARDTKLDRDVAIKLLSAEFASDAAFLERFRREAKTVASLNHPHIVTLYSVEEEAGVRFLTMELVEGQSLDQALTAGGLPLSQVLDIGIAIADALVAAEEKGIVHRDLKPSNVMLTRDGRVKVLDFGLAKLVQNPATDQSLTQDASITTGNAVMGTVPYMSPEQLRGHSVDHRSDIFSFGVLLYEIATGRRPFSGATNSDVVVSILRDTPRPVTQMKPGLPHQLGRKNTKEGFDESDALLDRVLKIDPNYAPAWGGVAANFANRAVSGMIPFQEGIARARQANARALDIDPHYAPAYAGLAFVAMYGEGDFAAAARYLEHAFAQDLANGRVLGNSATLLNLLGRKDEAVALWEAISIRDPLNVNALFNLGISQLNAGRLDEAIATYRTVLNLSPGNGVAHYQVVVVMLLKGEAEGALAEFKQESVEVFRMIGLPMAYQALGRKAESDAALAELIAKHGEGGAYNIAGVLAFRKEADRAFELLEKERRSGGTFAEIVVDPLFINLYHDPRWIPFLRQIGKAPEQLARISFKVTAPGSREEH